MFFQIEREVTDAMMKSLKYCDLQTESARQPLYQYRAATIHHRLASMYHSCFRNQVRNQLGNIINPLLSLWVLLFSVYHKKEVLYRKQLWENHWWWDVLFYIMQNKKFWRMSVFVPLIAWQVGDEHLRKQHRSLAELHYSRAVSLFISLKDAPCELLRTLLERVAFAEFTMAGE